jgi:hypothetical protein
MNTPFHLPASTIDALEYVVDRAPERLKDFLVGRSEAEKEAMRQHLRKRAMEKKKKEAADPVEDERRRIIGGLATASGPGAKYYLSLPPSRSIEADE